MKIYVPNHGDETLLLYAVRSWVTNCIDAEVVIVGEKPAFDYAAEKAELLETSEVKISELLKECATEMALLGFVWAEPNVIVCNKISSAHVIIPKRVNPHTMFMSCPHFFSSTILLQAMEKLSKDCSYTDIVQEYHAQHLYNIAGLTADWRTDNITLPMVSKTPDERKARSLAATKMFLWVGDGVSRSWLKKFLAPYFPDKQKEAETESDEEG